MYWGQVWVVDAVVQTGQGLYTVFCVGQDAYRDKLRRRFQDKPDLAAELREVARSTSQAVSERRRRRKYHNYQP